MSKSQKQITEKIKDLDRNTEQAVDTQLTSNVGLAILLREKITHFDHERILERFPVHK